MSSTRLKSSGAIAFLVAASLGAIGLAGAPIASAIPPPTPCVLGVVTPGAECVLEPGQSLNLILKAGNGGAGGDGGAGGAGGLGWDSSATVLSGAGGTGGAGGQGGAGAKWQGSYTNTTASPETLTFTVGTNGYDGIAGAPGSAGADATNPGPAADGATGVSGEGGQGGGAGENSLVMIDATTIALAFGGNGGNGGNGGAGGEGGQETGTPGSAGTNGTAGSNGADGPGGNLSTTWTEAPFIQIVAVLEPDQGGLAPWMQSYGRATSDTACRAGWAASWAQWANAGHGGPVCNRYIVWHDGAFMQTPDPDAGPFTTWDSKALWTGA